VRQGVQANDQSLVAIRPFDKGVCMQRSEFIHRVNSRCTDFLSSRRDDIAGVSPHAEPLMTSLAGLLTGGKKLRPALAWVGWHAAEGGEQDTAAVEHLGVALELFQAAALIHDDVIDRSATRRGRPSTHVQFEALHEERSFSGSRSHFGTSGAILAGDLALSWAAEAFSAAESAVRDLIRTGHRPHDPGTLTALDAARRDFQLMHTQVIAGQYLDVLAEVSPPETSEAAARKTARAVLRYKAAKYSTEYPIVIGAALAGAPQPLREQLGAAALPIGEAFQLRDDILGVFGDPQTTGKPVGDDLREGKRTELIACGIFRSTADDAAELSAMLGNEDLTTSDVDRAREILTEAGAVDEVESSIEGLVATSQRETARLAEMGVLPEVLEEFGVVTTRLVQRTS
jgi:geranylgeranyl diphosphate synthase type I